MSRIAVGVIILILATVGSIGAGAAFLLDQYGRVTKLEEHITTIDRIILGKPGPKGPPGRIKTQVVTIFQKGLQGVQGAKGAKGNKGDRGSKGEKGNPGKTLTVLVTRTVTIFIDNTKTHTQTTPGRTTTITTPITHPCPPKNPHC